MPETHLPRQSSGLVLLAHGSRDPSWRESFEQVLSELQVRCSSLCGLAYLQYCEPELPAMVDTLVRQGCHRIVIIPLFLGAGAHVRGDVPSLVQHLRQRHSGVVFEVSGFAGDNPLVRDALVQLALGALAQG